MQKRIAVNGLAILALIAASAAANAADEPGFYAGAGILNAKIAENDSGFHDSGTSFKLFGGYNFNDNFAVELGYLDAGRLSESIGTSSVVLEPRAITGSLIGTLPFNETFAVYGKAGYAFYTFDEELQIANVTSRDDGHESDFAYGAGALINFSRNLQLRAEYEAIDDDVVDFEIISLSAVYRF